MNIKILSKSLHLDPSSLELNSSTTLTEVFP